MTNLVILIVCCTAFASISQRRGCSMGSTGIRNNEHLFYAMLICYMIVFAGLRTYYNDTHTYIKGFLNCSPFPQSLSVISWKIGEHPGYGLYISIIKTFTDNYHIFIMVSSALALYPVVWFIRKYSKNFTLSIFIFFMLGYYVFCLAAIKQTLATSFALIAVDRYLNGKKFRYVLYILLAMTFHVYVLLYCIIPFVVDRVPWQRTTWLMILAVLVITYGFDFFINTVLGATDALGDSYDDKTFTEDGINIFRVLVYFVPVLISFIWRENLFKHSTRAENLFVNLSIVCALIMFIGLFGTANMFSRLAIFFEPAVHIALPWMLYKLKGSLPNLILTSGCYVAFPIFFYYQMVITTVFDQAFGSITLGEFFNSLFK